MCWKRTLLAMGLCALGAGCETPVGCNLEIFRYATRNLLEAPVDARDDCMERSHNRHLAEAAWHGVQQAHPDQVYTVYYAQGFLDGFSDYLYAGGTGEPPVVPPWQYRRLAYETPEGAQAVEDWFAGFRHGARAAQESGFRNLVVVPVALRGTPVPPWMSQTAMTSAPPVEGAPGATLPPPRKVPGPEEMLPPKAP
jgi:hypothetical protein